MGEAPKSPGIPWDRDLWQGPPTSVFACVLFRYSGVLEPLKNLWDGGVREFLHAEASPEIKTNIGLKQKPFKQGILAWWGRFSVKILASHIISRNLVLQW